MEVSLTCINFVVYMFLFQVGCIVDSFGVIGSCALWRREGVMQDLSFLMLLFDFIPG